MSDSIRISPKWGLNPTIPVCFWCGKEKDEIALMGKMGKGRQDIEAPRSMVIDYEPCPECRKKMGNGVTVMEVTEKPNPVTSMPIREGVYPTGIWCVIRKEAAERLFNTESNKVFVDTGVYAQLMRR